MLVVSNTSPILNLALIDRLSLIREQFTTVTIPKGVQEELRVRENLPGSNTILDAIAAKWLQVELVQDSAILHCGNLRVLHRGTKIIFSVIVYLATCRSVARRA